MNFFRSLLAAGQSYTLHSDKAPEQCLAAISELIAAAGAKPDKQHILRGDVSQSSFKVHRAGGPSREESSPVMIGTVTAEGSGSTIKATREPAAKYTKSLYKNVGFIVGSMLGLGLTCLMVSAMVPKVYAFVFLIAIPIVSFMVALISNYLWATRADWHLMQKEIAKACGNELWKTGAVDQAYIVPRPTNKNLLTHAGLGVFYSIALVLCTEMLTQRFWRTGDYIKVEFISRPAVEIAEHVVGPNNLISENCRYQLAEALRCEDPPKFKEIQILLERSLQGKDTYLKGDPIELAKNQFAFGRVLDQTGRHLEADKCYREAVDSWEHAPGGGQNIWFARALDRLSMLCLKEHKYDEAEQFEKRALEIDRRLGEKSGRAVGEDLNDLALVYDQHDQFQEAEKYYTEALEFKTKYTQANSSDGADKSTDYSRATTLYNLAEIEKILGHTKRFDDLSTEAYAIWKSILLFRPDYSPKPKPPGPERTGPITVTYEAPMLGAPQKAFEDVKEVPDPLTCYTRIMSMTKQQYEEPHLDTRFDGLRPYSGRE